VVTGVGVPSPEGKRAQMEFARAGDRDSAAEDEFDQAA